MAASGPLTEDDRVLVERATRRVPVPEDGALRERALALGDRGRYAIQAVIAAEHARAPSAGDTDWPAIARAYDRLVTIDPSPVIALNRAVAVAMASGPEAGLELADEQAEALDAYHLLHATRADLLRRLGRGADAVAAYDAAIAATANEAERAYLTRRRGQLTIGG